MYSFLKSLLFRLDAEAAHELTVDQLRRLQQNPLVLSLAGMITGTSCDDPVTLWGLRFRNRLGIAAGFDKNASVVPFLRALGFGFVEVGTVTLHPQPGNPKPRVFRFTHAEALVNRLGFNSDGARAVREKLGEPWNAVEHSADDVKQRGPLFVNIGKNRDVDVAMACEAYVETYLRLAPLADGAVLNLSSPNTPNLRELQKPEHLAMILREVRAARASCQFARPGVQPLLVKIAPDLDQVQLAEIVSLCRESADGIVATNTTTARDGLPEAAGVAGGLSGRPLFRRATDVLSRVRELAGPGYPLIGVGGVMTPGDAVAKIDAGADLVQAYTGFVYGGPLFASRVVGGMRASRKEN